MPDRRLRWALEIIGVDQTIAMLEVQAKHPCPGHWAFSDGNDDAARAVGAHFYSNAIILECGVDDIELLLPIEHAALGVRYGGWERFDSEL